MRGPCLNRRRFLQLGTVALGGLGLPETALAARPAARAGACILLYMGGSPSLTNQPRQAFEPDLREAVHALLPQLPVVDRLCLRGRADAADRTGKLILRLPGHAHWVESVAFSADKKRVLSASADDGSKWRLRELGGSRPPGILTGERLRTVRALAVLERLGTLRALAAGAPGVRETHEARATVARLTRRAAAP